jgi:hypothetical protein
MLCSRVSLLIFRVFLCVLFSFIQLCLVHNSSRLLSSLHVFKLLGISQTLSMIR